MGLNAQYLYVIPACLLVILRTVSYALVVFCSPLGTKYEEIK